MGPGILSTSEGGSHILRAVRSCHISCRTLSPYAPARPFLAGRSGIGRPQSSGRPLGRAIVDANFGDPSSSMGSFQGGSLLLGARPAAAADQGRNRLPLNLDFHGPRHWAAQRGLSGFHSPLFTTTPQGSGTPPRASAMFHSRHRPCGRWLHSLAECGALSRLR